MDAQAIKSLMAGIAPVISEYVERATAPLIEQNKSLAERNSALSARIETLEGREIPDVSPFCDADTVRGLVAEMLPDTEAELEPLRAENKALADENAALAERNTALEKRIEALEAREMPTLPDDLDEHLKSIDELISEMDAINGRIEKTHEGLRAIEERPEVDMEVVKQLVDEAVAELPPPEPGKKGDDCDMAEVARMVAERVDGAVAKIPPAKDGLGLADALRGPEGNLILTMTDGSTRDLGPINGRNGETFTLDDFDIEAIDERSVRMKFTKGNECHSFDLEFPIPVYRGVWKAGGYVRGDVVTWGGHMWHCDDPTEAKPGEDGWTQCVKKGRDGRPTDKPGMKVLIREVLAEQ